MTVESRILASLRADALRSSGVIIKRAGVGYLRGRQALRVLVALDLVECLAYRSAYLYRLARTGRTGQRGTA